MLKTLKCIIITIILQMKRRFMLSVLSVAITLGASAEVLTPEQALSRLEKSSQNRLPAKAFSKPMLKHEFTAADGVASVYVFDRADNGGYFVLSADDSVLPLLGYTDKGSFDENNIPPALQYWLDSYGKQISYIRSFNAPRLTASQSIELPDWEPVQPLVKTTWNQDAPYNNDCPESNGMNCYTGCVATSMAQVMNYFKYPEMGQGMISYMCSSLGKRLAMNLGKTPFDWDNMLDDYLPGNYTEAQGEAVAYLMKACGYSVEMSYSTETSGAFSYKIGDAMVEYFNYDKGVEYLHRSNYNYNDWAEIIYNNLKNYGPVIYDGNAPLDGGHSFVCDGYDGNGYFHFNWGWSGMSDGYYTLDALNPSVLGIGGGSIGGFNFDQDAVIGLRPAEASSEAVLAVGTQYGVLFGEVGSNSVNIGTRDSSVLGWGYTGTGDVELSFGVIVENLDNPEQDVQYYINPRYERIKLSHSQYIPFEGNNFYTVALKELTMEKGCRYKFTFASLDCNVADAQLTPVKTTYGYANYIIVKKDGFNVEVENIPVASFEISNIETLTTLYYGCPVNMKFTVSNNSDLQLSGGVTFELYNEAGERCFTSDSYFLTLNPGESIDEEQVLSFFSTSQQSITSPTEFTVRVINLDTNDYYSIGDVKVTMEKNPGKPTILTSLDVTNATKAANGVYLVPDNRNIEISVSLKVGKGYFAYPVSMFLMEDDDTGTGTSLLPLINQTFSEVPFLSAGDKTVLSTSLDFANPVIGKVYYLQTRYTTDNSYVWMNNQTQIMFETSGVDEVEFDENEPVKYFNLQGVEIANPAKGQLVIKTQGSKAQKMIVR